MPTPRQLGWTLLVAALGGGLLGAGWARGEVVAGWAAGWLPGAPTVPHEVVVGERVGGALHVLYERSITTGREQVRCLHGTHEGGTVRVTRLDTSRVYERQAAGVTHDPAHCEVRDDFLGTVHTHPAFLGRPYCDLSETDRAGLRRRSGHELAVVLCMPGRAVWAAASAADTLHRLAVPDRPGREATALFYPTGAPITTAERRRWEQRAREGRRR